MRNLALAAVLAPAFLLGAFPASAAWTHLQPVNSGVGRGSAIAIDAAGNYHVSTIANSTNTLRYYRRDAVAGTWTESSIDTVNDGRWRTSIAVDASGRVHVSYYGVSGLKYALWDGVSWSTQTVDGDASTTGISDVSSWIRVDASSHPHISYFVADSEDLKYARWTGAAWSTQTVSSSGLAGRYNSLRLNAAEQPLISFHEASGNNLHLAQWSGSSWTISTVDTGGGAGNSMALDASGYPAISYINAGDVKFARWNGSSWSIETAHPSQAIFGTCLALDSAGTPSISYINNQDGFFPTSGLNAFLRRNSTSGVWTSEWVSETWIDPTVTPALVLDANQTPVIAYDEYHAVAGNHLQVVIDTIPVSGPAAPTGLAGTALTTSSVHWSWTDNSSDEAGYRVMAGGANLSGDLAANTTYWVQSGLAVNSSTGAVSARVFNSTGTSDSSSLSRYTLAEAPTALTTTALHVTSATFTWDTGANPLGGITTFQLQRSTLPSFAVVTSTVVSAGSVAVTGLSAATTYYVRVAAINGNGILSAYTSTISAFTSALPYAPGAPPVIVHSVSPGSAAYGASPSLTVTGTRFTSTTTLSLQRMNGTGSWAATAPLSPLRDFGMSVLLDDGRVLLAGGMNDATATVILSSVSFFDPGTDTWSAGADMNSRRHTFALVKLKDGRVLAAGGRDSASSLTASAEVFDPATGVWTPTGSLSQARGSFNGVLLPDGRVLVAGGWNNGPYYDNVDIWDPATGSWTARAPLGAPRGGVLLQVLGDGRVLAAGGDDDQLPGGYTAAAQVYDPVADSWTTVSSMTAPRSSFQVALLPDGRVMAVGGASTSGVIHDSAEIFDPATGNWTTTGKMSVRRYQHRLVWLGGRLVAVGGMTNSAGTVSTAVVEAYDVGTGVWTPLGSLNTARFHAPVERLGDGRLLAAGGETNGSTPLSSAELFSVPVTTITATGVTAISSFTLTGTVSLAGAATGYWDVVARGPGEGRLNGGFRVTAPALASLAVTPASVALESGAQQALAAAGTFDNASTQTFTSLVVWTSSPSSVAVVSTAGVVTALAPGTALVTASSGSIVATATVTVSAFPVPSGFAGAAQSASSIYWSWTDNSSGELGYRVISGTSSLSGDLAANTTTWTQSLLTPNTLYGPYFARVFNSTGTADSAVASARTHAAAPTGSTAASFSATAATVSWSANGNPAGTTAELEKSTDNAVFSLFLSSTVSTVHDASLLGCTSYYYRARYVNADAVPSAYDATVLVRTSATTPAPPAGLTAEAVAGGRVALSWAGSPTEGITGYRLYSDGGTGTFDFGSPLGVFTSTESSFTTEVLVSSAAYAFNLRAVHRCGVEESAGVLASAASTSTLAAVRASIKNPDSGKRISGNRVTVMAELTSGTPLQVSQVLFQFRASTAAPWATLPAANVNHPNPDLGAPYFTHWDVTALAAGGYQLRAVAYDGSGNPDPAPGAITVIVDAAAPDIVENVIAGEIRKQQSVNNAVVNTIAAGGNDAGDALAKIVLPPGAVNTTTVTVTVETNPTITTASPAGFSAVGSSLRIDLSNGQHQLSGGQTACLTFSYPANVTDPSALSIMSLDEATGVWSKDFGTTVNASSRTITGCTPHFSIFAVFQGVATATLLDGVRLYPNPYKPNSGNADEGKPFSLGDDTTGIIFDQLPARVTIEIFSISGRRVTRFETAASGGRIRWNVRNSDGRDAASGGYFAVISSPGMKPVVKKFIVIR